MRVGGWLPAVAAISREPQVRMFPLAASCCAVGRRIARPHSCSRQSPQRGFFPEGFTTSTAAFGFVDTLRCQRVSPLTRPTRSEFPLPPFHRRHALHEAKSHARQLWTGSPSMRLRRPSSAAPVWGSPGPANRRHRLFHIPVACTIRRTFWALLKGIFPGAPKVRGLAHLGAPHPHDSR